MKKLISFTLSVVLLISFCSTSAFAAYEAPVQFAPAYNYGTELFSRSYFHIGGGINYFRSDRGLTKLDDRIYGLPWDSSVDSFCFYKDKCYFLAGCTSDAMAIPGSIYSCNLDGSGLRKLANNASYTEGHITIVDNYLYYAAFDSNNGMTDVQGYAGGIYRINLNDLSYKKLTSDRATIYYCDGDYIYYGANNRCYAIRTDGTGKVQVNPDCDEFKNLYWNPDYNNFYLKGNHLYYTYNNNLYVRNKNGGNARYLGTIPRTYWEDCVILAVTDDYVLCAENYFRNGSYVTIHRFSRWPSNGVG